MRRLRLGACLSLTGRFWPVWAGHSPQVCLGTYAHLFDTVTERIEPDLAIRTARYGIDAGQERAAG